MEEVRFSPYRIQKRVHPATPQSRGNAPHFKGVGDLISSGVGFIDSSRLTELLVSDGMGMVVPRTGMAYSYRGADDGRETFLREMTGLVCNVMLAGWAGYATAALLGNRMNPYNPHAIPVKAWIPSKNLRAFGQLYNHALQESRTPEQAREQFVHSVLNGLESGDRCFSVESRLASLKNLSGEPERQAEMLGEMLSKGMETPPKGGQQEHYLQMLRKGEPEPIRKALLNGRWGRLSVEARDQLCKRFEPASPENWKPLHGTAPLDALTEEFLAEHHKAFPPKTQAERQKDFLRKRLELSLQEINGREKDFMKVVDQEALLHGLTGTVNLKDANGKVLAADIGRKNALQQMKHFLEQYVDRAAQEAKKQGGDSWIRQRDAIRQTLFADTAKGWRKLVPTAGDGLLTATLKAKGGFTWVPLLFTLAATGVLTFLNNYLTMKKYGGRVFFPGEDGKQAVGANTASRNNQRGVVA